MTARALRFRAEIWACRGVLALAGILPRALAARSGSWLGELAYRLDWKHRRIMRDNLLLAFGPSLGKPELRRISRACWRHFGRCAMDTLYFHEFGPHSVGHTIHYEGLDVIRAAYARGKGVLLFSGHFGHWELTALMQGYLGLPLVLVTRPLDNPALETLLAERRRRSGNTVLHKRDALRELLRALRRGRGVAIVIDQDARRDGVFVPFFGRPASTTPTLALLALRTGAAVVPTFSIPGADGSYRIVYEPELPVVATGDSRADVLRLTAEATATIERWVRRHPQCWLWMHRRWKTAPRDRK
jgi:KDO2-lipid IV(A) lauroyltransferase